MILLPSGSGRTTVAGSQVTTKPDAVASLVTGGSGLLQRFPVYARLDSGKAVYVSSTPDGGPRTGGSRDHHSAGRFVDWGGFVGPYRPFYVVGTASRLVSRIRIVLDVAAPIEISPVGWEAIFPNVFHATELPRGSRPLSMIAFDTVGRERERVDASSSLDVERSKNGPRFHVSVRTRSRGRLFDRQ
jgi:hypothetical protein